MELVKLFDIILMIILNINKYLNLDYESCIDTIIDRFIPGLFASFSEIENNLLKYSNLLKLIKEHEKS